MKHTVYIAIFLHFARRLLRKTLAPSRRNRESSRDIPGDAGNMKEYALFLVDDESSYYVISGTAHEMDKDTADWLYDVVRSEWSDYCTLIPVDLSIAVLRTGPIDQQIYELDDRLDTAARARLRCLVNGARATYNDKWRWYTDKWRWG